MNPASNNALPNCVASRPAPINVILFMTTKLIHFYENVALRHCLFKKNYYFRSVNKRYIDRMKFLGIIPARYSSSRFPGKPLAQLGGKPVIQHVYERAKLVLTDVYVATDDVEKRL